MRYDYGNDRVEETKHVIFHLTYSQYDQDKLQPVPVKIKDLITAQSVIELTVLETE